MEEARTSVLENKNRTLGQGIPKKKQAKNERKKKIYIHIFTSLYLQVNLGKIDYI